MHENNNQAENILQKAPETLLNQSPHQTKPEQKKQQPQQLIS